ncbi:P-loop NTPase family protein [Streptomyces yaizuensis]|uniref:ParA family protein n=1 Tax=Streptomyces yaizuensis TaxID=2989713 RepID=A0AA86IVB2_9ACTN|nr:hypothetical protein [Streptomyces sp. YSPA8]BDT39466.1 hypothetical protein SYYSPA8_36740 [Streptomyces sp. YSPA8]
MSAQEHGLVPSVAGGLDKTVVEVELEPLLAPTHERVQLLDLDSQPSLSSIPEMNTYKPIIIDTPGF